MMLLLRSLLAEAALRKPSLSRVMVAAGRAGRISRAGCSTALLLLAAPWAVGQVTFNYTGAAQTFTVPAGVRAIQIQAGGGGGGGGGSDNPGAGGAGGRGSSISAVYSVVPGTVLKVIVGGGGSGAAGPGDCNTSGGAGGLAGGAGGLAGGKGGNRGCSGYSGAGGGGGAATVVTTEAGAMLLTAGGGGGGQGGALNLPGKDGSSQLTVAGGPNGLGPIVNSSASLPGDAVSCAPQNGNCVFSGIKEVWYGAGSGWAVVPAANGVSCSHILLGDPNSGVPKSCYYRPYTGSWTPPVDRVLGPITSFSGPLPGDATFCAPQDGTCDFSGIREFWYGADSGWAKAPAANGAVCSHLVMGDPNFGVVKACYSRPYTGDWAPPSMGTVGGLPGMGDGDGGGGGGGGGGCPGGAGSASNVEGQSSNTTTSASGGGSCSAATLPFVGPGATVSATGGLGGGGGTGNSSPGAPGAAGFAVITYPTLTLAKSQPSPALVVGADSVYALTVTNTNATGVNAYSARVVDQLPASMTYISSSGTGWSCSAAANAGGTLVTCDFTGTINANGGTAVLQITARPINHLTVTNYAAVDPTGSTSPPVPTTCTAANTPAGCAAPVVSPVPVTVSGYGYADTNHNNARDAGEAGRTSVGNPTSVKITTRTGSVCNFPALAVASVGLSPGSGAYSFPNVPQGDYCLLLQRGNSLTTNEPGYPSGYVGTENGTGVIQFTVSSGEVPLLNFGLHYGSRVTGTVFTDNGAGGGTANNGVKDGAEAGLAGIPVILTRDGTELARATSSGDGSFVLWQPPIVIGPATITPALPGGYTATGGSPGTLSAGSYTRPSVNYTLITGRNDSGITFGMVASNTLAPNGANTAQPGSVVFYAHTYTAATGGQVTFSLANAASPVNSAWSQVLYQDNNCNARVEAYEPQVTGAITVTAGQRICLIVKQYSPAGAALNARNVVTLSAAFSYTNAAPALDISTLVATDITTVGEAGDLALGKLVGNVTQGIGVATSVPARPGDTLEYLLSALNNGSKPLSTLVVSDATPAYTSFVSATCPTPLPAGITGCAVATQPAVGAKGAVQWIFTGSLTPGAEMYFYFKVKVDE